MRNLRSVAEGAALALMMSIGSAQATVITGTWSWDASDFPPGGPVFAPTDPFIGSATFSLDTNTSGGTIPLADITTNLPAGWLASAIWGYQPTASGHELTLEFEDTAVSPFSPDFFEIFIESTGTNTPDVIASASATYVNQNPSAIVPGDATASFAAAPVPEPTSLAIFGAGLAALGVMRRKRKAS